MQNFQGTVFIINTKIHGEFQICISLPFTGGSRAAATSKMECFVIIVNGFQPLTIITKYSVLDVAAALDPPLDTVAELKLKPQNFTCFKNTYKEKALSNKTPVFT